MRPAPVFSPSFSDQDYTRLREAFTEILAGARLDSQFDEEQAMEILFWRTLGLWREQKNRAQ